MLISGVNYINNNRTNFLRSVQKGYSDSEIKAQANKSSVQNRRQKSRKMNSVIKKIVDTEIQIFPSDISNSELKGMIKEADRKNKNHNDQGKPNNYHVVLLVRDISYK